MHSPCMGCLFVKWSTTNARVPLFEAFHRMVDWLMPCDIILHRCQVRYIVSLSFVSIARPDLLCWYLEGVHHEFAFVSIALHSIKEHKGKQFGQIFGCSPNIHSMPRVVTVTLAYILCQEQYECARFFYINFDDTVYPIGH